MHMLRAVLSALLIASSPGVSAPAHVSAAYAGPEIATRPQQEWALALGAILDRVNNESVDQLGGMEKSAKDAVITRQSLERFWSVTDRASLLQTLDWLQQRGHREQFTAMAHALAAMSPSQIASLRTRVGSDKDRDQIDTVVKFAPRVGSRSILAWDLGRYVLVCGWGYRAGYLTEQEAWERIMPIARMAQKSFDSWHDFGSDYMIGRRFWSGGSDDFNDTMSEAYSYIVADPASPWHRISWKLDLTPPPTRPAGAKPSH
jgi:hypothetical protein